MARNTKFDCIEKWVKAHPQYKIYEFPNDKDPKSYVVVWVTSIKKFWGFFEDYAFGEYNVDVLGNKPIKIGKWQCDGTDNFMFTSGVDLGGYPASPKARYSKDNFVEKEIPQQPNPTTELGTTEGNPIFNCVKNYYADFESKLRSDLKNKTKYEYFQDYMSIISPDGSGDKENFFTDGKYEYFTKGKLYQEGKWFCKGERDYDVDDSKPSPEANDSFPLKLGSKGPNVVKLQKFLNDKIPGNPLTVNGVFDQKTADKLIEFQKKEEIIK